jgi:RNA polymerase sigma-70 factor (ECF subfamily)
LDWGPTSDPSEEELAVLRRYMSAHEQGDSAALAQVLREDVRVSFTPLGLWAEGREEFIAASKKHAAPGEYRFVATRANMQPAAAVYVRAPGDSAYRLLVLEVLRIYDGKIAEITDFGSPAVLRAFGLPTTI